MGNEEARKFPKFSDEVYALIGRTDEFVSARDLAPICHMNPGVIVNYAKTGKWTLSEYVISGNRVKFSRLDFLRKMGFIPEEAPQKDVLAAVLDELKEIRQLLAAEMERKEKK